MSETMRSARARYHSQLQDSRADAFIPMPVSGFVVNTCTVSMLTSSKPKERPMRLSAPFTLLNPLRLLCPLRTNESQSDSTNLGGRGEGMSLEACGEGGLDSIKWIWKRQTRQKRQKQRLLCKRGSRASILQFHSHGAHAHNFEL